MIKILFVIHDLSVGGAEKVLVNLANNMDQSKFDVTVLSLFGGGVNERFLASHVRYLTACKKTFRGNSKLMKLLTPEQLHKSIIRDHYDIEVAYLEGPCARIVSGCKDPRTKTVSWIHCMHKTKEVLAKSFRSFDEAANCYASFNRVVCVSGGVKRDFWSLLPSIAEPMVLYNPNDTNRICELAQEDVDSTTFDPNEFNVIALGKLEPVKGFDMLLNAHEKLVAEGYKVHTRILGVGSLQETILRDAEARGLGDSFELLGYQTNPYKYLAKSDLFVCSSRSEGFSTATTEALVLGVPCVSSPVSGATELLGENNEYGIVTDGTEEGLFESVKTMIESTQTHSMYKSAASARGNKFSLTNSVSAIESFFLDLAGESK